MEGVYPQEAGCWACFGCRSFPLPEGCWIVVVENRPGRLRIVALCCDDIWLSNSCCEFAVTVGIGARGICVGNQFGSCALGQEVTPQIERYNMLDW
jgi:hypothetical protein